MKLNPLHVSSTTGAQYNPELVALKSADYAPALWTQAPNCNFSSRNGTAISAVTVHTVQGSYSGAISWGLNCNANVSYHYVVRSSDGQITQMVLETNKAWHVGTENPYTIGIEHEGYVSNAAWYTNAMYQASANLVKDITQSGYSINPLRTYDGVSSSGSNVLGNCLRIKGHQHYQNQTHTDPGINWNWPKYYLLINNTYTPTVITNASGTLYDSGGANGNYANDERKVWRIQPTNGGTVQLNFWVRTPEQACRHKFHPLDLP
ncbi:MAG: N-acetylmuramoyl-L-alanine amidase [Flavobacteriia bacterium]|nr:N-acetylmuramoyl-L-alanine amidase [Flavobacteriia bacterium]